MFATIATAITLGYMPIAATLAIRDMRKGTGN